mgnify:CR=1 FL=1
MKVVLDTNVLISGLLWRGGPWEILKLAEAGQVTLCITPPLLEELEEVLKHEKLRPRLQELGVEREEVITYVLSLVSLYEETCSVEAVSSDPSDNIVINCALSAGASLIISGDRHLLTLARYQDIQIISPHDFITGKLWEGSSA